MNQLFLTAKMNLLPKLWKQFGSFSSKDENENETFEKNSFSFMQVQDDTKDDGDLRWDEYGNPYIRKNYFS